MAETIEQCAGRGTWHRASVCLCLCVLAPTLLASVPAVAATRAGTGIANTATLSWNDGTERSTPSNTVSLLTAEILDVTITAERSAIAVKPGDAVAASFVVTNTGNGAEDFTLAFAADQPGVAVTRVAIDRDGDGTYDAAKDELLAPGVLPLAPGQAVRLFVLIDGGKVTATARITASVAAKTGSGTPGTAFAGAGDGGGDAVVGTTGAAASAATVLTPPAGLPGLVKSQSVFAPDGSTRAVRGAIVTYRLVASFSAATRGVALDDPIPAGTAYVPGSLVLDDSALTDAADTDAGVVDTGAIHVALGNVATPGTRTVQFSVKIQ